MTYIVTENCIKCKFQDCVAVCPVDCFYEGENFLVIHPEECIDCGVCEPECPAEAIRPDTDPGLDKWLAINTKYAEIWPNISEIGTVPADAESWNGRPDKASLLITGEEPDRPHAQKPVYEPGAALVNQTDQVYETDGAVMTIPAGGPGKTVILEPREPLERNSTEIDGLHMEALDK